MPAFLLTVTPLNAILVSGGSASYIAGQDINQMYAGNSVLCVRYADTSTRAAIWSLKTIALIANNSALSSR
jgi:hypothetical protein